MSTIKSSAENLTLNADGANNDIKFQSNGSEVASIDQAGVVTTGGAALNGAVTINDSGADVDFRVESDGLTHALFVEGGNGRVGVNTDSPDYSLHMVGDRLMTENLSNGTTGIFMRVKNGGSQVGNATISTTNNGDISIFQGTSSEALRATLKQGGGICFNSDTAASNALDDYEEGTFTPNVGGDATYTNQNGAYTKVGRLVTVKINFQINAINSSGRNIIYGLPFTSTSGEAHVGTVGYYSGLAVSPTWIGCYGDAANTQITFIWNTGNSATIGANGQNLFQNSARIDLSLTYQTT